MAQGSTITKRIKLDVSSGTPKLSGITSAINELSKLNNELLSSAILSGRLASNLGAINFGGLKSGAATAASQINQITISAERAASAIAEVGKMPVIPPGGKYVSQSRIFANQDTYARGDAGAVITKFKPKPGVTITQHESGKDVGPITVTHNPEAEQKAADKVSANAARMSVIAAKEREAGILAAHKQDEALTDREIELASRRNRARAIRRQREQERSEAQVDRDVEQAERNNKARAIRRQRIEQREEESKNQSIEQASRNNRAAALRQQRTDDRVKRESLLAKRKYQEEIAALEAKYGRTSSTNQNIGKERENIKARQDYINRLRSINTRGASMGAVGNLDSAIHNANLGIISRSGKEGPWWTKLLGGDGRWLNKGLKGWTPEGMIKNTLTAGGWMVAVTGIMKVTEVVEHSLKRMIELELHTAVLRQTFRGAGGSAAQLADDVMKLGISEGRSTEEAMKAAIHWTRLGMSRRQAGEATVVSLMAANVAEMTASEATEKLSSVMITYNQNATDLSTTLGMLARTSQTYGVKTGELLDGISRVSNIAKEAGMSLAELQALLGSVVQKTGLSGERSANAIQQVIGRLYTPAVQEFFERRYAFQVTGKGDDLAKIYSLYKNANNDERQSILLKVGGGPRQMNLAAAILERIPDMYKQAADSLTHLNAAEEENVKITNTAHAAMERLGASWDNLLTNNASGLGRSITNTLNNISGIINGFTGKPGGKYQAKYFDPSKATTMGSLAGLGDLVSFGLGSKIGRSLYNKDGLVNKALAWSGLIMPGNLYTANEYGGGESYDDIMDRLQGRSSTPQTDNDRFGYQMRRINQQKSKAEAHVELAKYNKYITGDKAAQMREEAAGKEDMAEYKRMLGNYIAQLEGRKKDFGRAALKDKLSGRSDGENLEQKRELSRQILELKQEQVRIDAQDLETVDHTEMKLEQMSRVMTEQRMLGEDLANTLKGIGMPKWVEDSVGVAAKLQTINDLLKEADDKSAGPGDKFQKDMWSATADALRKEKLGLESEQLYRNSPQGQYYREQNSFRETSARMTGLEVEGHGAGLTEGERAMDRRRWIQQEMKKYNDTSKMDQADLARAAVLLNSLKETEFAIQGRILNIERERKQVLIETQREFQRSLITAGPGEILRKLAMNSLTRGGRMGAGQFFSMSPEMRGDAYTLMGGERMAQLNWEKKSLAGQGANVKTMQNRVLSGEQQGEKIASAIISAHAKAASHAASVAKSMESAAAAAAIIAKTLSGIKPGGMNEPINRAPAPTATPVPQAEPINNEPVPQVQQQQASQPPRPKHGPHYLFGDGNDNVKHGPHYLFQ